MVVTSATREEAIAALQAVIDNGDQAPSVGDLLQPIGLLLVSEGEWHGVEATTEGEAK